MSNLYKLHFNADVVADITALIGSYAPDEFNSPFRSTAPLLALLKESGNSLQNLLDGLGVGSDAHLFSEYQIKSKRGRGKASHTDLMITSSDSSWAIEVKWSEPRYPTVAEWIAEGKGETEAEMLSRQNNRREVANGWLDFIRARVPGTPALEAVDAVVYQTLHRAASANLPFSSQRLGQTTRPRCALTDSLLPLSSTGNASRACLSIA